MNRWNLLLIACAVLVQAVLFALVAMTPDPYCFVYELGLGLLGGIIVPPVAAFVCGLAFALTRAPVAAYVLLVASLSFMAATGFVLGLAFGYDHCVSSTLLDRGIPWALIGLGTSLVGLAPGFIVGWLVRSVAERFQPGRPDA